MMEGLKKIIIHVKKLTLNVAQSKSKTFLAFCFCFIAGAGLASVIDWRTHPYPAQAGIASLVLYFYVGLFILVSFSVIFWKKLSTRFFILCSLFFFLGVWRFTLTIPDCSSLSQVCFYNGREVTVVGRVSAEPDIRIDKARYVVEVSESSPGPSAAAEGSREPSPPQWRGQGEDWPVTGRILLTTRLYPQFNYGDTLQITCKIDEPENSDDGTFNYKKYLAKEGIYSVCGFPKSIMVIVGQPTPTPPKRGVASETASPPPAPSVATEGVDAIPSTAVEGNEGRIGFVRIFLMSKILNLKSKIANQINLLWPEPESSFMAGLLYGSRAGLPPDLMENFSKTGVTHIIAVSGFNITIIASFLMIALIAIGLWRRQAFWVIIGVLFIFVIFTGASPSVIRAAIMGVLVLSAQQLGRLSRIGNTLVFTAAAMVAFNPYVLFWDAGFQLSFLATMGLVYVSPVISAVIARRRPDRSQHGDAAIPLFSCEAPSKSQEIASPRASASRNDILDAPLAGTLTQTFSAIIATLPLILYQFGRLSIVAPLVNILILWTIPYLMLVGFIAVILSYIFFPLGQLVAFVASIGLKYVILVVEFFGNKSWSSAEFSVSFWVMSLMYAGLIVIILCRKQKQIETDCKTD